MRCTLQHTIVIAAPPARVFPLFTPEGERAWVAGWNPRFVPESAEPSRAGSVFVTDHDGEVTLWMVAELEAGACRARYIRHTEGSRVALVSVDCSPCPAGTRVEISYDVTGLSEAGNEKIRQLAAGFAETIAGWKHPVEAALARHPVT